MKTVLLLNPPAPERVSRDYYCGHVAKGNYYWPATDLLYLSGFFRDGYDVHVLDAIVEGLDAEAAHGRIDAIRPDVVISMMAAISWGNDVAFLTEVKRRHDATILVSGDYPRADARRAIEGHPCIDAVIIDFSDSDIVTYVEGTQLANVRNLYTRQDEGEPVIAKRAVFDIPIPRHELFPLKRYHVPQIKLHPFTMFITDYGCPFKCGYCYYERIDHKRRNMENIREELEYIHSLGIRELLFMDPSFGAVRKHAMEVCETMRGVSSRFSWVAEMRADSMDEELLRTVKAAGCHTLMIGVETPDEKVLAQLNRRQETKRIEESFALCRKVGIRTLAHFIIGLDGEDEASIHRLIDFSLKIKPDIASYNVARPAWNTSFRDTVVNNEWMIDNSIEIANPDYFPVWESPKMSRKTMWRLRNQAMKRFYMRPSYMASQLLKVRSTYQLRTLFREGWHMMNQLLRFREDKDQPPSTPPTPKDEPVSDTTSVVS